MVAFRSLYCTLSFILAGITLSLSTAAGQSLLQPARMSDGQAWQAGFKRQAFSFQAPEIDFSTFVPKDAEVKTMPQKPAALEQGQLGKVLSISQMYFSKENIRFDYTAFSYQMNYPPSPLRTCVWQMAQDNYTILHTHASDELVKAQVFGIQTNGANNTPQKAAIGYCYVRSGTLIAAYFTAHLTTNEKQAEHTIDLLRQTVAVFIDNMTFANGKPNGPDPALAEKKTLVFNDRNLDIAFPGGLDASVEIPKAGALPYRLHLVQNLPDGKMFGHLMLAINKTKTPATETALRHQAEELIKDYIATQVKQASPDIHYEFAGGNSVSGYAKEGITARSYQYRIIEKQNADIATLFHITLIQDKDTLYTLYYHSMRLEERTANQYLLGAISDVAYDMLRSSVRRFLLSR